MVKLSIWVRIGRIPIIPVNAKVSKFGVGICGDPWKLTSFHPYLKKKKIKFLTLITKQNEFISYQIIGKDENDVWGLFKILAINQNRKK